MPDLNIKRSPAMADAGYLAGDVAPTGDEPVLKGHHSYATVTDEISDSVLKRPIGYGWVFGLMICMGFVTLFTFSVGYLFTRGVGIWGNNIPVAWGFPIVNFVWWVGIGHAGTFISAFLLLLRQDWRTSINRFAEAMTLFAVACAGMYPLLHLGRPWLFYWLMPYPNTMWLWPQFRSPLVWDVFAVSTYASVSALFWFVGLIPDLATFRDRTTFKPLKFVFGAAALGWRSSARHWHQYQTAYLLLAGLAAPLVVSVHSVVGMDFAGSQVPGWHNTIFPPYFVAGAIFSGFSMVVTLAIPLRKFYNMGDFITLKHIERCGQLMLVTGLIVAYGYMIEVFMGLFSGVESESFLVKNRMIGPYAWSFWALWICNIFIPQALWFKKVRQNIPAMFIISIIINIGMWLERFVIIITSLSREYLVSSWHIYKPTFFDFSIFFGTIGFFLMLFLLFIRVLPAISIFEMRELVHLEGHVGNIEEDLAETDDAAKARTTH